MTKFKNIVIGAAGLAAVAVASPALAQTWYPQTAYPQTAYPQTAYPQTAYPQTAYPQAGYPQQYGYQQPSTAGQVIGAIINSVTGGNAYGQYPMGNYGYNVASQRTQVQQCAIAAERRIAANYSGYGARDAYGRQIATDAYGRPVAVARDAYGRPVYAPQVQAQSSARVLGVTAVERRANGVLRVRGVATSGAMTSVDVYGRPAYGNNAQADLSFNCRVDARGRVLDVDVNRNRNSGYRSRY